MSLILSGTDGLSDVDGTAATPAIRGTDANTGIFFPAADTIAFAEGGVESMRIDSSGNLGIGTATPVAKLNVKTLDATNAAMIAGTTIGARFSSDSSGVYIDGTDPTGSASYQPLFTGGSVWGVRIAGTERMRIDSSGNVGIGTTSPLNKLDARAASAVIANYQTIQAFSTDSAAIDLGGGIGLGGFYSTTSAIAVFGNIVGRKENATGGNFSGYLAFGTNNNSTGIVERMRIDSSGNVFVGGTTQNTSTKPVYASNTAKAWVSFGGTGAINGSAFNVSSVTRISTGNFEVNFSSAMPNTNFVATANSWQSASNSGVAYNVISFTTAKYQISTYENNALTNPTAVYSIVFGT